MISCKESTRLSSLRRDGQLPWYKYPSLLFHLAMCRWCKWYCDRIRFIGSLARKCGDMVQKGDFADDVKLADDARERIRKACAEQDE